MAQIDVLRPVSTRFSGAGIVVPSGTMHGVTSDDSDATYIEFNAVDSGNNWSLRVGSHTPPADHERHQIRGRVRIRTDAGFANEDIDVGRGTSAYIEYETVSANASFSERFTSWFRDDGYGLAQAGALDDLNIGGGWLASPTGGATETRTAECYIDIDCRQKPSYSAEVRDAAGVDQSGGTVTDTNQPTMFFGAVDYDGLPSLDWLVTVNGLIVGTGSGVPPTSFALTSGLADGAYTAVFRVRSTIREADPFASEQTITFNVANEVPPPSPPILSIEEEFGGYRLNWFNPGGQEWDDGYVVAEVWRDDCNGSQRIATVPDGLNGSYLDLAIPQLDHDPCGAEESCDITYRVRYWGYVSTTVTIPSTIPPELILAWPSTIATIPSGWTRVAALDDRYPIGATGTGVPSATGGTTSHTHTTPGHVHAVGAHNHGVGGNTGNSSVSTTSARFNGAAHTQTSQPHSHARPSATGTRSGQNSGSASPGATSANNEPPTRTVIWIQSSGAETAYPVGVLAFSAESVSGWTDDASSAGRFLKGAPTGGIGGTNSGASTHTHTLDAHTHVGYAHDHSIGSTGLSNPVSATEAGSGSSTPRWLARHTHPMDVDGNGTGSLNSAAAGTTGASNHEPPNRRLRVLRNTGGGAQTRIIGLYLGDVASLSAELTLCNGANGTPDMRGWFARERGSNSVNSTGGSSTHTHSTPSHAHSIPSHTHTTNVLTSTSTSYLAPTTGDLGNSPTTTHDHTSGATAAATPSVAGATSGTTSSANHIPPYREAHFVRMDGTIAGGSLPVPELKVSEFSSVIASSFTYDDGLDRLATTEKKITVVTDRSHTFPRLVADSVPLEGGLHTISTTLAGEDVTLVIGVQGKPAIDELEEVLGADRVYYSPVGGTAGWFAPTGWRVTAPAPDVKVVTVTMVRQDWPTTSDPEEFL